MNTDAVDAELAAEGTAIARACAAGFTFDGRPDPHEPTMLMGLRQHTDYVDVLVIGLARDAVAMGGRYPADRFPWDGQGEEAGDDIAEPTHSTKGTIMEVIGTVLGWPQP